MKTKLSARIAVWISQNQRNLNYHLVMADLSKFRNDELHITILVHVDDGLLFSPTNCKTAHDLQEHKWWCCAEGIRNPFCMVTKTTVSELQFRWSRTVYPHNWNYRWIVTRHLFKELGNESREHLNSQSAKTWASKRGLGRMQHVMLQYMFVQDVMEEKQTTFPYVNTKSNKADMMTKCHTNAAHMKGCASISRRDRKNRLQPFDMTQGLFSRKRAENHALVHLRVNSRLLITILSS